MPAQRHDATALMLLDDFLAHADERHTVKVLVLAKLKVAEVETHHGRIVAADLLNVRTAFLPTPGATIHRVVLMSDHNALLLYLCQAIYELDSRLARCSH